MADIQFGTYLKQLRMSRSPSITQEQLATAIGRTKMTISQFESGKNSPPRGDLLNRLVVALKLSSDEETKLRYLAGRSRLQIPSDIESYFFEHPSICLAIRAAKESGVGDDFWKELSERVGSIHV